MAIFLLSKDRDPEVYIERPKQSKLAVSGVVIRCKHLYDTRDRDFGVGAIYASPEWQT